MLSCKLPAMETTVSATVADTGDVRMRVEVWPSARREKDPTVEYTLNNGITFIFPEKYIRHTRNFLSTQLDSSVGDRLRDATGDNVTKIRLEDPIFQDTFTFALVLDYMKRSAEEQAVVTLRRADTELTDEEWGNLNELERFVFQKNDRNPYWSGLTAASFMVDARVHQMAAMGDRYDLKITPGCLIVKGPARFMLCMFTASINYTDRPESVLMEKVKKMTGRRVCPFDSNGKDSFFIPHNHIQCMIEGKLVQCEGVIHSDGYARIEPVDTDKYTWFHFTISRRFLTMPPDHALVYGAPYQTEGSTGDETDESMEEEGGEDDVSDDVILSDRI